jgi:hypothetical protein
MRLIGIRQYHDTYAHSQSSFFSQSCIVYFLYKSSKHVAWYNKIS